MGHKALTTLSIHTADYAAAHELAEREINQQVEREVEAAWQQYEANRQKESES
ncbi:MAG: hypothetical protein JXA14_26180 [Anaerolineae bacterium]|nr:hypothetical protein [Anaerolineae bacterium]